MPFLKSDFAEWRDMGITQAMYSEINSLTEALITEIINRRQQNAERDWYVRGFIAALSEIAGFEPEFIQEEEDGNTEAGGLENSSQTE